MTNSLRHPLLTKPCFSDHVFNIPHNVVYGLLIPPIIFHAALDLYTQHPNTSSASSGRPSSQPGASTASTPHTRQLNVVLCPHHLLSFSLSWILNRFREVEISYQLQLVMFLGGLRGALAYSNYTMIISYSGDYSDMFVDSVHWTPPSSLKTQLWK